MPEAGFARAVGHKPSARITASFGKAANTYDPAAIIQAMTAATLVDQADKEILQPAKILDIGCGTGLVLEHAKKRWPEAHMTGLDASEDMLRKAAQKVAGLDCIHADAADFTAPSTYDIIFSNMMLHWLQSPLNALQQWQNALKPLGRLYIATLAEGSFHEWAQLCHDHHVADNLWPLPTANFAGGSIQLDEKIITYSSAYDFLKSLKNIGAHTPKTGSASLTSGVMRQILRNAPRPFAVTYKILYITMQSAGKI